MILQTPKFADVVLSLKTCARVGCFRYLSVRDAKDGCNFCSTECWEKNDRAEHIQ